MNTLGYFGVFATVIFLFLFCVTCIAAIKSNDRAAQGAMLFLIIVALLNALIVLWQKAYGS